MKVRNIMKKVAVLGASAAMLGATILGATAYNLGDYPSNFIVDGQFNGKIVVGEKAATSDVLGAIDIAASLQADSVTEEPIEIPGVAGEVNLKGDVFRIETSSDLLELREPVGAVYDTLTESELDALRGGSITTDEGTTSYNQYLRFNDGTSSDMTVMAVNYAKDEDDNLGDFLIVPDDKPFVEYELEFTEGLESSLDSNNELDDLEDEKVNIFGTDFTIVDTDTTVSGTTVTGVTLEFMAGDVSDVLKEGETKTYTIDGVDYEVTLTFVSDPNTGTPEAKFTVNGEPTDSLKDGDTDTLSNGLQIGVRDLLVNSREGSVEFYLGANKVQFTDNDVSSRPVDSNGEFEGTVEINNENIEDASVDILGDMVGDNFEITDIKYRLKADAKRGSTLYIPAGHGVREYLDEPEGMLSPSFDIKYEGLKDVKTTDIKIDARGDDEYHFIATNLRGKTYDVPLVNVETGTAYWGDDEDDFWFTEPSVTGNPDVNLSSSDFWIGDDDYFVLSEHDVGSATEKDDSAILRYEDIDTSDKILTFTDMASGDEITVTYTEDTTNSAILGKADNLVVEGNTYTVWVGNTTDYPLAIDLNGDGDLGGDVVPFVVKGGGIVKFGSAQTLTLGSSSIRDGARFGSGSPLTETMSLTTLGSQFDSTNTSNEVLTWDVTASTSLEEVHLGNVAQANGILSGSDDYNEFKMWNDEDNDDYERGMTDYGAKIDLYDPTGNNDAEELTIAYPETQVGAQVFVTAGTVEKSQSGSSLTREVVNPLGVGIAVLDKDVTLGEDNLIIVGGPCANTVAADFLGNPANCAEGFEPGKAMIAAKEVNGKVAILVAGYEAQETRGASYVLADYKNYLSGVDSSEVEVIVSDLNNLQVVTPTENTE